MSAWVRAAAETLQASTALELSTGRMLVLQAFQSRKPGLSWGETWRGKPHALLLGSPLGQAGLALELLWKVP